VKLITHALQHHLVQEVGRMNWVTGHGHCPINFQFCFKLFTLWLCLQFKQQIQIEKTGCQNLAGWGFGIIKWCVY